MKINRPVRDTGFSVPCTVEEKNEICRRAAEKDMTISAYVRWVLKNYPSNERKEENNDRD